MSRDSVDVKTSGFVKKLGKLFFSSSVFPLVLAFTVLAILFVLFRMNNVEMDYKITSLNKKIKKVSLEDKELKAKKAKLMSMKRLRILARKYNLREPQQKQIIVVP